MTLKFRFSINSLENGHDQNPLTTPKLYIISTGEARRSQSAIFFNIVKKNRKISNQRHRRCDPRNTVSQASTSTIVLTMKDEGENVNPNLTARPARTQNTDAQTIKLNIFCAKSARYKSHKDFLSRRIQEKLVPKGLELHLEPTIGNYDQEFFDSWYFNLKYFTLILRKHIAAYCKKTEEKTQTSITEIEATLKQQLKKADYAETQKNQSS